MNVFSVEIVLAEIIACLLGIYGLYTLNKVLLNAKILKLSAEFEQKMTNHANKMNKFRQDFAEFAHEPRDVVSGALGDIGIEGIMQELGIDPGLLKNPLVKGLIEKYAPRLLEGMNKGVKSKGEEIPLL